MTEMSKYFRASSNVCPNKAVRDSLQLTAGMLAVETLESFTKQENNEQNAWRNFVKIEVHVVRRHGAPILLHFPGCWHFRDRFCFSAALEHLEHSLQCECPTRIQQPHCQNCLAGIHRSEKRLLEEPHHSRCAGGPKRLHFARLVRQLSCSGPR